MFTPFGECPHCNMRVGNAMMFGLCYRCWDNGIRINALGKFYDTSRPKWIRDEVSDGVRAGE